MNWLLWLLIGVVLGWLIEFVIDYLFWQRRCEESSVELTKVRGRIGDLESRALAAERESNTASTKLTNVQSALEKAHADLTGAHTIQETLRNNIQLLEDRVDNWGRKIGLLTGAGGLTSALGAAFSHDDDDELKSQIDLVRTSLNSAVSTVSTVSAQIPSVNTASTEIESTHDPLHEINGIGAVYEQRLNDAGIFTFAGLIAAGSQRIREIINPKDWQAIDTEDWLSQAQHLIDSDTVNRGGAK